MPTGRPMLDVHDDADRGGLQMSDRAGRNGRAVSLVIAWILVLGAVLAFAVAFGTPVRGATCDQGGQIISGDWAISTPQVCTGWFKVDGNINITSGGSLTLANGGLNFTMDNSADPSHSHHYALNVNAGGALVLDNSIVTTNQVSISPYLYLPLTVTGANFEMKNYAMLKFPGWFNASGATITVGDSKITGFSGAELSGIVADQNANDDGPIIRWASTTALLYRSNISKIYEYQGTAEANLSLSSASTLTAYDTYIGVDYSNVFGLHNELQVDGNSNAYLYNVTIDRTQDPPMKTDWQPAYRPSGPGGNIYLFRWLQALVVDSTGFPVSGAKVWSTLSLDATTAAYPDNGGSIIPKASVLSYLGRSPSGTNSWNTTDPNGRATIPLYTDEVTTSSLPNALSFGNYQLVVRSSDGAHVAQSGVSFSPYPAVGASDNNAWVTIPFTDLQVRTGPDLAVFNADYPGTMHLIQNQPFPFYAVVHNQGQTAANDVTVAAFLDGSRSTKIDSKTVTTLAAGGVANVTLSDSTGVGTLGAHTIMIVADPDNTINEGGVAQESNNFANITLDVQPPPNGAVAIGNPENGLVVEPGAPLSVTGYARDNGLVGIGGISLMIELRSGSTIVATNSTLTASDGLFVGILQVPSSAADGQYTVTVTPAASVIQSDSRTITVQKSVPFLNSLVPLIGIPWWMFLIILAAVAAAIIGVTLYFRVYGLGKMVECGECGAFIPEDATVCPKCGVAFEKDMAKCSNCQAWIPVDVKECPECGVQFATGQLDMADYQEKMRLQYDEVVQKLKEDAGRQLGRALSDKEFQEWWRKQPSFVTFEDWLREEEEMRKMGSKPCPVCGTLNSVTATVCHKCGSMMKDETLRGSKGAPPPVRRTAAPAGGDQAPAEAQPSRGPVTRTVAPTTGPVVVQKKVVRRPTGEADQSAAEGQDQGKEQDEL